MAQRMKRLKNFKKSLQVVFLMGETKYLYLRGHTKHIYFTSNDLPSL